MNAKRHIPGLKALHYVYVAAVKDEAFALDLERLKKNGIRIDAYTPALAGKKPTRKVVAKLCDPTCLGLLVPDDYSRHTDFLEDTKLCAQKVGVAVLPVTRFLLETKPAPASAVPATQHSAVAGPTIDTTTNTTAQ